MIPEVQLTEARIRAEVAILREAGERVRAEHGLSKRLLERIGADDWPESNGAGRRAVNGKKKRR